MSAVQLVFDLLSSDRLGFARLKVDDLLEWQQANFPNAQYQLDRFLNEVGKGSSVFCEADQLLYQTAIVGFAKDA
jgi:hypothetical protein